MFSISNRKTDRAYRWLMKIISSKYFFWSLVVLAAIQGLWYAIIFQPNLFDESYHVMATYFYLDHASPFLIGGQNSSWDYLGAMSQNSSYMFYYFMSLPLRLIRLFTSDQIIQVVGLRVVMISFFAAGLVMYRKSLRLAGFSSLIINAALLAVVLLPNVAPIPGVVNYDNVIFFLFPTGLYFGLKAIKSPRVNASWIMSLLACFLAALLIKFSTALVLFMPIFIYLIYDLWSKHHARAVVLFVDSFKRISKVAKTSLIVVILSGIGLLLFHPVANYVNFRKTNPSCSQVLTQDRCLSNPIEKRRVDFLQTRSASGKPYSPYEYATIFWIPSMINTNLRTEYNQPPFPIVQMLYFTCAFFGVILILINWNSFMRKRQTQMLAVGLIVLMAAIFYSNYRAYVGLGQAVAMNGRYLLPYMPIFGSLALASLATLLSRRAKKAMLLVALPITLLLLTQGGGMTTPILIHDSYWKNDSFSKNTNLKVKSLIQPYIKEKSPFKLF
jgi:hypothetical protein